MKMTYLNNLDRESFEIVFAKMHYDPISKAIVPKRSVSLNANDERSRRSIEAFLGVFNTADALECIVDEEPKACGHEIAATEVHTEQSARLVFTYSGQTYSAKVMLGDRRLSVKRGVDAAEADIIAYLKGQQPKGHITRSIKVGAAVASDRDEGPYDHLTQRFDLE